VSLAIDAFGRFTQANAVPEDVRRDFQLALDEVLSNVVRHGLEGRAGSVDLAYGLASGVISVEVADDAPRFDPLSAPAPDTAAPLDDRVPGGLGIALIAAIMDEVRYERRGDRNHLIMKRRIAR
jgi:serine/threonine-protein kinase RsbW